MKLLRIKKLRIENYKAIKNLEVNFSNKTTIMGENESNKSTIGECPIWILTGKDRYNRTNHEIRPLGRDGKVIRGIETSVEGTFILGDRELVLKRTYREKLVQKKGELEKEFKGHETLFEVDGIPCSQTEYQKLINNLIDEDVLKLTTNIDYFTTLKLEKKREILVDLSGDISIEEVTSRYEDLKPLEDDIKTYGIETLIKREKMESNKLKNYIQECEIRANECEKRIVKIDLTNLLEKRRGVVKELDLLTGEERERNIRIIAECDDKIKSLDRRFAICAYDSSIIDEKILALKVEMEELKDDWVIFSEQEFEELEECPFCKREFEKEFMDSVNADRKLLLMDIKEAKFNEINEQGLAIKERISELNAERSELQGIMEELLFQMAREIDIRERIRLAFDNALEERDVEERVDELRRKLVHIDSMLSYESFNEMLYKRIEEIRVKIEECKIERARCEKLVLLYEKFVRCKISMLEDKINSKFSMVKFKLFHEQINGGIIECCECTYKGVPFSVLNTAARVNCSLDIINTLSEFYGVSPFVIIDGRESVNNPIKVNGQVIELMVTNDKELVIEGEVLKKEIKVPMGAIKNIHRRSLSF
ncbi:MAG: AAA family ATPase [Clostridium sp.]